MYYPVPAQNLPSWGAEVNSHESYNPKNAIVETVQERGKILLDIGAGICLFDQISNNQELNIMQEERYTYMAGVMKALAHPTRLFIVDELSKGPRNVGELTEMVGIDMSTISRHLSVLKQNGIIAAKKQNNQMIYHLLCPCVLDMYKCVIKIKEQAE